MRPPNARGTTHPALGLALGLAAAVPPLIIAGLIARFGVNVPFQDDWDTASILVEWRHGTLTLADFWVQHSEHRILTVRLVVWLVGVLTDLNLMAQMFVGAASVMAALLLYKSLTRTCLSSEKPALAPVLTVAGLLLLFTMVLQERWFFGTAATELLVFPLAMLVVWLWTRWPGRTTTLVAALTVATLGTFVEASGLALWPTGLLAIVLTTHQGPRRRALRSGWILAGALVIAVYFWDLHWERTSIGVWTVPGLLWFVFTNLGVPFTYGLSPALSASVGAVGVISLSGAAISLRGDNRARWQTLSPMVVIAVHGLLVAASIGIGRSVSAADAPMISHYAVGAVFFWMGAIPIIAVALGSQARAGTMATRAAGICALALLLGHVSSGIHGYRLADERHRNLEVALASLYAEDPLPPDVSRFLYPPDDGRVRRQIDALKQLQLGPFAPRQLRVRPALKSDGPTAAASEGFHDGGNCEQTTGWAWNAADPDAAAMVDVWLRDEKLGTATAHWFRRDLERAGKGNGRHGFVFVLPTPIEAGTGLRLTVTLAGTKTPVTNSPLIVMCP